MPNPIFVEVGENAEYTFETHATNIQYIELRPRSKLQKPQNRSGSGDKLYGPFGLDAGKWDIYHTSSPNGKEPFTKGRGRVSETSVAEFDDDPVAGDNDFDDVQMVFIKGLIKLG